MSSITPDAVRAEIAENAIVIGNPAKTAAKVAGLASYIPYFDSASTLAATAVTASKPVYIDSSSVPQTGTFPFSVPVDVSALATTTAIVDLKGTSTLSGSNDLGSTLVTGSAVTTATITAYVRVKITDAGGNVTDGFHYMPVYSLA